ncbi:MAG: transglycosylase domain-containing protein, partial [Syntrophomonas sp.]|nr:transglycosylase domain-containing protein [Syntrophomonas sp.]
MRKLILTTLIMIAVLFGTAFNIGLPSAVVPKPSTIYDVNGQVLQGLAEQNTVQVEIDQISTHFLNAIIAVEDKDFYQHHGVDVRGLARAMWVNIKAGKIVAGGSTITQQTAKTLFLSNERTWSRKIKELYYSILMENRYSKEEILTMYCNSIYFGEGAYGVELASRTYFAKKAIDLSLSEASLLAGLPQSPSYYDPYLRPEEAKARQQQVLQRMVAEGMITVEEKEAAAKVPLAYKRARFAANDAPYFVAVVRDYLREKYGDTMVYRGGLRVYTTLDPEMQKAANQAYQNGLRNQDANLQVALVA